MPNMRMIGRRNKEVGARGERAVKSWLISRGWHAIKVGGSFGPADVYAVKLQERMTGKDYNPHRVLYVQVKTGTSRPQGRVLLKYVKQLEALLRPRSCNMMYLDTLLCHIKPCMCKRSGCKDHPPRYIAFWRLTSGKSREMVLWDVEQWKPVREPGTGNLVVE